MVLQYNKQIKYFLKKEKLATVQQEWADEHKTVVKFTFAL